MKDVKGVSYEVVVLKVHALKVNMYIKSITLLIYRIGEEKESLLYGVLCPQLFEFFCKIKTSTSRVAFCLHAVVFRGIA